VKSDSRSRIRDFVRSRIESVGAAPTYREIGDHVGISAPAAWKHIAALVEEGVFVRKGERGPIYLPDHVDLTSIATDALRGELARRGVTFDALAMPKAIEGRACAAYHCGELVKPGQLMCREHWFALPPEMRSDIMNAWRSRQVQAYQDAVEAARNHLGGFTTVAERVE
jgi:hypothetical protein